MMFCTSDTRAYIRLSGDSELLPLIDYLETYNNAGMMYYPGVCLSDIIYDAIANQWEDCISEFNLPPETLDYDFVWTKGLINISGVTRDWIVTQRNELKVYWECNKILENSLWDEPDKAWDTTKAAFYVAKLFRYVTHYEAWKKLEKKYKSGGNAIIPPGGFNWESIQLNIGR